MALKKVTVHFRMSDELITSLYGQFPSIIQKHEVMDDRTLLYVDVTPQQESQIVPVLQSKFIEVEDYTPP
jgi:hypothetical protein